MQLLDCYLILLMMQVQPGDLLSLIEIWLRNKFFYIDIVGLVSKLYSINYGTVQWLILGPVFLFNVCDLFYLLFKYTHPLYFWQQSGWHCLFWIISSSFCFGLSSSRAIFFFPNLFRLYACYDFSWFSPFLVFELGFKWLEKKFAVKRVDGIRTRAAWASCTLVTSRPWCPPKSRPSPYAIYVSPHFDITNLSNFADDNYPLKWSKNKVNTI